MRKFALILLALALLFPLISFGKLGVGVGAGKIKVDKDLKPGGVYNLPSVPVLNTGDEPADYGMEIAYHEKQSQFRPSKSWFEFIPSQFHLEPGKIKSVKIKLTLPVKARPGDYFAYLEAHPIQEETGGATIGIAAATKLYFTIVPTNIFSAVFWRLKSLYEIYYPWPPIVLILIIGAVAVVLFRKHFRFNVSIRKKKE